MKSRIVAVALALTLLSGAVAATPAFAADNTVTGAVTLDGAALGGIEVGWYDPATRESGETTADTLGNFTLSIADTHAYVLYVGIDRGANAFKPSTNEWKNTGGLSYVGGFVGGNGFDYVFQGRTLLTGSQYGVFVGLHKPGTITGTAVGTTRVDVLSSTGAIVNSVSVDPTIGSFTVRGLLPSSYRIEASGPTGTWMSEPIVMAPGADAVVTPNFATLTTGSISGVVTARGKPAKNVSVSVGPDGTDGSTSTDSKGRYTIHDLAPGKHSVVYGSSLQSPFDPARYITESHTVTVAANATTTASPSVTRGGTVTGSVVRLSKSTSFTVTVLDTAGRTVGGQSFTFSTAKPSTSFSLTGVKKGKNVVVITENKSHRYAKLTKSTTSGSVSIGAVTPRKKTITLTGKVTGATSGGVWWLLGKSTVVGYNAGSSYASIKNGTYTLKNVVPGKARLSIEGDHTSTRSYPTTIAKSATRNLTAGKPFATITGTVLVDGRPLPEGTVEIGDEGRQGTGQVVNGALTGFVESGTGRVIVLVNDSHIDEFQPGPYSLSVPAATAAVSPTPGQVIALGTINLTVNH